ETSLHPWIFQHQPYTESSMHAKIAKQEYFFSDRRYMSLSHPSEKINIFFSLASAPEDRDLFAELRKHLSSLRQLDLIEIWYDSAISAGQHFKDSIKAYISQADIIVFLVS